MRKRLGRLDWVFSRAPVYYVTACTRNRREVLVDQAIHERLLQFAEDGPELGAWMGAYVLMPDHLHVFVALHPGDGVISLWILGDGGKR